MPIRALYTLRVVLLACVGVLFLIVLAAFVSLELTRPFYGVYYSAPLGSFNRVADYVPRLLDGSFVAREHAELTPFVAMIENHIDSRPVAGLDQALVVYEAVVEGDITRFMAVFDQRVTASRIGPIRSARPFFVTLAEEWNGVYFHAGGSPAGLEALRYSPMPNINEISADGIYFWRDLKRTAPHNLYTSGDQMRRAFTAKQIATTTEDLFVPWHFKDDDTVLDNVYTFEDATLIAPIVEVAFTGNDAYRVTFVYDPEKNEYTRYVAGEIHKTEQGIILKAKNIVKQYVAAEIIDSYGRLDVAVDAAGNAELYQDGIVKKIRWERSNGRTLYFDETGEQVAFNRGRTWIVLNYK